MKKKFFLKVNRQLIDSVFVDTSKLRRIELGRREVIKAVLNSSKFRKKFLGKEIVSVNFSFIPKPEINVVLGERAVTKRAKKNIVKGLKPILEKIKKREIKKAEKEIAKFILFLLERLEGKKIRISEISDYLESLWWSKGFIENIPEPLNSAVLEGADLSYFYEKGKESRYHLEEFKSILDFLRKSAEKILERDREGEK